MNALTKEKMIFPTEEDDANEPCSNKTYDILAIYKAVQRMSIYSLESHHEQEKGAVSKEYEKAVSRLHGYSKNEAER